MRKPFGTDHDLSNVVQFIYLLDKFWQDHIDTLGLTQSYIPVTDDWVSSLDKRCLGVFNHGFKLCILWHFSNGLDLIKKVIYNFVDLDTL